MDVEKKEETVPVGYTPLWFQRKKIDILSEECKTEKVWPLMLLDSSAYVTTDNHAELATQIATEVMGWQLKDGRWYDDEEQTKYSAVGVQNGFPWSPSTDLTQAWYAVSQANARWGVSCNLTNVSVSLHINTNNPQEEELEPVMLVNILHRSVQPSLEMSIATLLAVRVLDKKFPSACGFDEAWVQHVAEATRTCIPCNPFLFSPDPYPSPEEPPESE